MEDLLYRIFNRKIIIRLNNKVYTIKTPSANLRYKAEIYKQDLIDEHKYDLPHLDFYNSFLIKNKFIDSDYETKIKNMNEAIKNFKVQLYKANHKIEESKKIRNNLKLMKTKLNNYYNNIEFYRRQSLEYFAETLKNKFILINTTYYKNKLIFNTKRLDLELLQGLVTKINSIDISTSKFREIARSEDWRTYWLSNKYNLFGIPAMEYSEDQKILSMFSRMYDNIFEHPERPLEDIINDDDKLDGWMILEQAKNKDKGKEQQFSHIEDKYQEVFITATNQEEANLIYDENSDNGKRILKERAKVLNIHQSKNIKDIAFRDVQLDVLEASSRAESAHIQNLGKR